MATPALPKDLVNRLIRDRAAGMSVRDIAKKHGIGKTAVAKATKERIADAIADTNADSADSLITQGVKYKQTLNAIRDKDVHVAEAIADAVDFKVRAIETLNKGAMFIAQTALKKVKQEGTDMLMSDLKQGMEVLGKAKENIVGKETTTQVNTQVNIAPKQIYELDEQALIDIATGGGTGSLEAQAGKG